MLNTSEIKLGIQDMSNDEYHSSPGISNSMLSVFIDDTPLNYWHRYINKAPQKTKKAFDFGKPFHTFVLEPEKFDSEYFVIPKINKVTKVGKALYADYLFEAKGRKFVSAADMELIKGMALSISKHRKARALIKDAIYEKTIFWEDEETGMLCRCRPDIWRTDLNIIVDLKTTVSAKKRHFASAIDDYGYHRQAAIYLDGVHAATKIPHANFVYIAVDKEEPWPIGVYDLSDESIEFARPQYKNGLKGIKKCTEEDYWPGHTEDIEEISLPYYAMMRGV